MTALYEALQLRISVDKPTADKMIQIYVPAYKQNDYTINYFQYFCMIITDYQYRCPTLQLAEYMSRYNLNAYAYVYAQRLRISTAPPVDGAAHADELNLVFGDLLRNDTPIAFTNDERAFTEQLVRYWGNFISTNKPSASNDWPRYTDQTSNMFSRNVNFIKMNSTRNSNFLTYDSICQFWNTLVLNNYF